MSEKIDLELGQTGKESDKSGKLVVNKAEKIEQQDTTPIIDLKDVIDGPKNNCKNCCGCGYVRQIVTINKSSDPKQKSNKQFQIEACSCINKKLRKAYSNGHTNAKIDFIDVDGEKYAVIM